MTTLPNGVTIYGDAHDRIEATVKGPPSLGRPR
jgi:hypothetical protein